MFLEPGIGASFEIVFFKLIGACVKSYDIKEIYIIMREPKGVAVKKSVLELEIYVFVSLTFSQSKVCISI